MEKDHEASIMLLLVTWITALTAKITVLIEKLLPCQELGISNDIQLHLICVHTCRVQRSMLDIFLKYSVHPNYEKIWNLGICPGCLVNEIQENTAVSNSLSTFLRSC